MSNLIRVDFGREDLVSSKVNENRARLTTSKSTQTKSVASRKTQEDLQQIRDTVDELNYLINLSEESDD